MNKYWKPENTESILKYIKASTLPNSKEVRDSIVNTELQKPLYIIAESVLAKYKVYSYKNNFYDDYRQDVAIFLINDVLPKLSEDKIKTVLKYLWKSAMNYVGNNIYKKDLKYVSPVRLDELEFEFWNGESYLYKEILVDERKLIIDELNKRISKLNGKGVKSRKFLTLLREYIVLNDFDVRGFSEYVKDSMSLGHIEYMKLALRLGISSKILNEKLINEKLTKDKINNRVIKYYGI